MESFTNPRVFEFACGSINFLSSDSKCTSPSLVELTGIRGGGWVSSWLVWFMVGGFYPGNPKSQSRRLLSLCIILLVLAYFYAF